MRSQRTVEIDVGRVRVVGLAVHDADGFRDHLAGELALLVEARGLPTSVAAPEPAASRPPLASSDLRDDGTLARAVAAAIWRNLDAVDTAWGGR